jgi:cupin fold WbuC family metalloprotein
MTVRRVETDPGIPRLTPEQINDGLQRAQNSTRRRYPRILHEPGAEFNRVVNFILHDSYMQPHLHPEPEKVEYIHCIQGRVAVIFFDNAGAVSDVRLLDPLSAPSVNVPAFTFHTYVMLSEHVVSYETMMGRYDPTTWKALAEWAPPEGTPEASAYLTSLKKDAEARLAVVHGEAHASGSQASAAVVGAGESAADRRDA